MSTSPTEFNPSPNLHTERNSPPRADARKRPREEDLSVSTASRVPLPSAQTAEAIVVNGEPPLKQRKIENVNERHSYEFIGQKLDSQMEDQASFFGEMIKICEQGLAL